MKVMMEEDEDTNGDEFVDTDEDKMMKNKMKINSMMVLILP